jgi:hypothetical protein
MKELQSLLVETPKKFFTLQNVASFFKCKVFFRFESVVSDGKYVCKMITFYCTPCLTRVNMFDHIVVLKNWTAALKNNSCFIRFSLNLYHHFLAPIKVPNKHTGFDVLLTLFWFASYYS